MNPYQLYKIFDLSLLHKLKPIIMTDFISNLANGWTAIDLLIMTVLLVLWLRSKKEVECKEKMLEFADISKTQLKDDLRKEIVELKASNETLQKKYDEKANMLSRCIDRPKVNNLFVKKDYKPVVAYIANEDVYNSKGLKVFTEGMQYPKIKAKTPTLYGDDGMKYIIDIRKFSPVY